MSLVEVVGGGVTRLVVLVGPVAVKFPRGVRGWLANRSEWRQRWRPDVAPVYCTVGHLALVMRRGAPLSPASATLIDTRWPDHEHGDRVAWCSSCGRHGEKFYGDAAKPDSWAEFPGLGLRLVDFDAAWEPPRGLVGAVHFARQELHARRWSAGDYREGWWADVVDLARYGRATAATTYRERVAVVDALDHQARPGRFASGRAA